MKCTSRRFVALGQIVVTAAVAMGLPGVAKASGYSVTDLISDPAGPGQLKDPNLQNAWGITSTGNSPFWVGSNGRGSALLYQVNGTTGATSINSRVVFMPGGATTGTIFNSASGTNFSVATTTGTAASTFLFVTENGHISGWNPNVAVNNVAEDGLFEPTAVYKGVTITNSTTINGSTGAFLYATDFRNDRIRVTNSSFGVVNTAAGAFTDPNIPAGFAPFNVANIGGKLYVSYAKQDDLAHDDVAGPGNGFIDTYNLDGTGMTRLVSGGNLDSPWGMALAPAGFGDFGGDLLVGNFGDGLINAYDPNTGAFRGTLSESDGTRINIDGVWGLAFGTGAGNSGQLNTLYFTAGPNDESQGLFGAISVAPVPEPTALLTLAMAPMLLLRRRQGQ